MPQPIVIDRSITASTGHVLPLLPPRRPVDSHWHCVGSGDCCTMPLEVVMTKEEAAEIVHAASSDRVLQFRPVDERFVALKARPCPLFEFKDQTCSVYAVRPYNCRRFGCFRPNIYTEKFEASGATMMDRVKTSRVARRLAQRLQRKAMGWAQRHGWPTE